MSATRCLPSRANRFGFHGVPLLVLALASFFLVFTVIGADGITDVALNTTVFVLIFSLVVGVHELSHLGAARALGVEVHGFTLGFGPELFARKAFGIRWAVRLLPLGGFVKLRGEDEADGPHSFAGTTTRRRVLILLAGPASNILLAFGLIVGMALVLGVSLERTPGAAIDILQLIMAKTSQAIANFVPQAGIHPLDMPIVGIPGMITGVGTMLKMGPVMVVILAAVISFSMGIMNGLPLPPLDGGQALVAVLHHVFGARYPTRVMAVTTRLAFVLLIMLMVSVNAIDIFRTLIGYTPAG